MNNKIYCAQGKCECKYIEDVNRYSKDVPELYNQLQTLQETNQKQADRIKELEEALSPFACTGECAENYPFDDDYNSLSDCRLKDKCNRLKAAQAPQPQEGSK